MAPYDKSNLPLIITDTPIGVHSVRQLGQEEYEVKFLNASKNAKTKTGMFMKRWLLKKIDTNKKDSSNKKQKKSKNNKKKVVAFADDKVQIREIPHRSEITPEQKAQMWRTYHDWSEQQIERQRVQKAILNGHVKSVANQTEDCFVRGLEILIPELAAKRREHIHVAKTLVLREQARARLDNEPIDVGRLAWWYASAAQESKEAAIEQGIEDYFQTLLDNGCNALGDLV